MANRFLSNITINDSYTFPSADGDAGQIITTDGSGNLSFTDISNVPGAQSNFIYYTVKNSTGGTLNKGIAVRAVGTDGNSGHILINKMVADGSVEPKYFMGVLESTLGNGDIGRVIHFGELDQFNTSTFQDGDVLWCDPAVDGGFTTTEPEGPNVKIAAAIVINASTNGKIKIRVQGNEGLHELHDVKITSQANGDLLQWNSTTGVWENKTLASVADSRYVNVSGDTMTGGLIIQNADPTLTLRYSGSVNNANSGRIHFVESPTSVTHFEIQYDGAGNTLKFNSPIDGTAGLFTINRSGNATVSNNLTVGGTIKGPSTFYIDPSPDDTGEPGGSTTDTGTVVILGDLQVTGTTTTIDSTTLNVGDKNIVLAKDAAQASEANGAGITIETGTNTPTITDATLLYNSTNDTWAFNKWVSASRFIGDLTGTVTGSSSLNVLKTGDTMTGLLNLRGNTSANNFLQRLGAGGGTGDYSTLDIVKIADTSSDFMFMAYHAGIGNTTSSPKIIFGHYAPTPTDGHVMTIDTKNERVGIGISSPTEALDVNGNIISSGLINSDGLVIDNVTWNSNKISIQGASPNIQFRDTGTNDYWWQVGSNGTSFYILHDTDKDGEFESTYPLKLDSGNSTGELYGSRIFADNYHPNADKWTTARTVTFSGDISGSFSIDGSANVSNVNLQVANDSHTHDDRYYTESESDDRFTKYVNLTSQVQLSNYCKSVIALCNADNSDVDRNSYSIGTLTFHRTNGLSAPVKLDIAIEKRYNANGTNVVAVAIGGDSFADNIQYVTFEKDNVVYGGIEFYFTAAQHHEVTFYGRSNFDIFGLDYYDDNATTQILNQEVYDSISTTDVSLETDFFFNNNQVWHAGNDGDGSGLDADTLDTKHATDFTLQYVTDNSATTNQSIQISASAPLQFTNTGSGTYNRGVLYSNTNGLTLEAPRATDSASGDKEPVTLTWRGGYSASGGLQLTNNRLEHKAGSGGKIVQYYDANNYAQIEANTGGGVIGLIGGGSTNVFFRSYGDSYFINYLGVGTNDPISQFHVVDNTFPQVRINDDSGGGNAGIRFRSYNGTDALHADVYAQRTGAETGYLGFRVPYNSEDRIRIQSNGNTLFYGSIEFDGPEATTTNQNRGIYWTGFDKEGVTDFSDTAHIRHTTNTGGLSGSVLEIKSHNDAADGINFVVNSTTSGVRINGNTVTSYASNYFKPLSELGSAEDLNNFRTTGYQSQNSNSQAAAGSNYPTAFAGILETINDDTGNGVHTLQRYARYNTPDHYVRYYYNGDWSSWTRFLTTSDEGSGNGLDADSVDGLQASSFIRSDADDSASGVITFNDLTIHENGIRIGTGSHGSSANTAAITFGEGDPTGDAMVIEYDGEGQSGDNNQIAIVTNKDGSTLARFKYSGDIVFEKSVFFNANNLYFDGSSISLRSDNHFAFLTDAGAAQQGKFKGIQVSTTYSGSIPDNGILFYNDTNLYRSAANRLKTDDDFEVAGDLTVTGGLYVEGATQSYTLNRYYFGASGDQDKFYPFVLFSRANPFGTVNFTIEQTSQGGGDPYNFNCLKGFARGQGWSDGQQQWDFTLSAYQSNEIQVLGVYRGTASSNVIIVYLRGGENYNIITDGTAVRYATGYNIGTSNSNLTVAMVKDANGDDVAGQTDTSQKLSLIADTYNNGVGRYYSGESTNFKGHLQVAGVTYTNRLQVSGGDWNGGGTEGDRTDLAMTIPENKFIYTLDGTNVRRLIGKSGDYITLGETGTSLIKGIKYFNGTACDHQWYNSSSIAMNLSGNGLSVYGGGNTLRLTGAGSNSAQIYATGANYGMRIDGASNSSTYYLMLLRGSSNDVFYVRADGRVGVNTSSPLENFHVSGTTISGAVSTTSSLNKTGITNYTCYEARSTQTGNNPAIAFHKESVYTFHLEGSSTPRGLRIVSPTSETAAGLYVQGDVVAYYSDMRLKTKLGDIENPVDKVKALNGFYYEPNEKAQEYGYEKERRIGLSAQDVKEVIPEAIHDAPMGDGYMAVDYAKIVPVLVEAIKEQQKQIEELKNIINNK